MDFRLGPKSDAFRAEVRAFLDEHLDEETIERAHRTGTNHDKEFHRAIGRQGWLAATWPAEYGGQERDPFEMTALRDELRLAGAPTDGMGLSVIVCQTIRRVATDEQKADFLPRALAGEICMSLGLQRARLRLGRGLHQDPGRPATATSGSSTARRCSPRSPTWPTTCSSWPAPTTTCPSTRG